MINLVVDLSIYIFLILIICFMYYNFRAINVDIRNSIYEDISNSQRIIILLALFVGFSLLYLENLDIKYIYLFGQEFLFLIIFFMLYDKCYKFASKTLINNVFFLLVFSYIMITRLSYTKGVRQFYWSILSSFFVLIIPIIIKKIKILLLLKWTYAVIGFVILITVFFFGKTIAGAKNWIIIGEFSFQPSEIVKIIYIFFIAALFRRKQEVKSVIHGSLVTVGYIFMLILQKDLGTALIFFIIYMVMLYVATSNALYFFGGLVSAIFASIIAHWKFSHVRVRVEAWLNPWEDISGNGHQIAQSLFAIGTGGWFGLGLGKGLPHKIPVVETDFIFSAISEEFGSIFAIGLIMIMLFVFMIGFNIAKKNNHGFYALSAVGLSCAYAFQVFLIIGGVTKLIPLTGVTLPFVSYGGSSLLSSFFMLSIFQSLYIMNEEEYDNNNKEIHINNKAISK